MKRIAGLFLVALFGSISGVLLYKGFLEKKHYIYNNRTPSVFSKLDHEYENPDAFPNFVKATETARPAVVHIQSTFPGSGSGGANLFKDLFGDDNFDHKQTPEGIASGSGVIISETGYITTNNHVVEGASEVNVTLVDNRSFKAKVIGTDPSTDLALLKIEGEELPFIQMGNSDEVKVGEWVLAIGNPMELNSTVTAGIVSAKARDIRLLDNQYRIESFIQTDAVVNRGNSGGALVNTKGELIGINTAIASRTGFYAGYSFAVPAAIVKKVMEDLLKFGEVRRGILGIKIASVNAELAEKEDLAVLQGAFVESIGDDSGAKEGGLKEKDVIIAVNDLPVSSSSELQEYIGRYRPDDNVKVKVLRGDKEMVLTVKLKKIDEKTETFASRGTEKGTPKDKKEEIGEMKFRTLSPSEKTDLEISSGIVIESPGSKLSKGGVKSGFVVTKINGKPVSSISSLEKELESSHGMIRLEGMYERNTMVTYSFPW
jgi:Do/DeqQ family serine protease